MEKLHKLFPPTDKSTWFDKIQKDLKDQSIEDLCDPIFTEFGIDPFAHFEDLGPKDLNLLSFVRSPHQIPLQQIIERDPTKANQEALFHLQNGAGSLLFQSISEEERSILLHSIDTDMAPILVIEDQSGEGGIEWSINLKLGEGFIESCQTWLRNLYVNPRPQTILLTLSDHLYQNLALLRAIQVLHKQLESDLGKPNMSLRILCRYEVDQKEDLAYNLQASMPKVLSAILGGAHHILSPDDCSKSECKWYHNLVHLLTLESALPLDIDTMTGSFYIEKITNAISDRVWSEFYNSIQ